MKTKAPIRKSGGISGDIHERASRIVKILDAEYPESRCSLDFKNPFELLVATILSSQCTDARVNKVTPTLFKKLGTPRAMARARHEEIEKLIQSTGFYKNKAAALKESAQVIVEKHRGNVPSTLEELTKLRGVGRKTANVVLGNAFGVPGIPVDTHVSRVAFRLGLTAFNDPEKIERDLMMVVPKRQWTHFSHLLISHGRVICTARKAYCDKCPVTNLCPKIGVH